MNSTNCAHINTRTQVVGSVEKRTEKSKRQEEIKMKNDFLRDDPENEYALWCKLGRAQVLPRKFDAFLGEA